MSTLAKDEFVVWNWAAGDPVPDANVVVCRPGLYESGTYKAIGRQVEAEERGTVFIVSSRSMYGEIREIPADSIPALYAEQNADLESVRALLNAHADRRALVLCPRKAINLHDHLCCYVHSEGRPDVWGACCHPTRCIDIVIIIPPPEASRCGTCNGSGHSAPWS